MIRNRYLVMLFHWLLLAFLLKSSTDAFGDENRNGSNSSQKCPTTSDGKKVCVRIEECPSLLNKIAKMKNESEKTNLLKILRCERRENNMYCCRTQNPEYRVNSSHFEPKTCVTSDGQTGTLTNARNCSLHPTSLVNPAPMSSAVVFPDQRRKICCPLSATLPTTTENVYARCGKSEKKSSLYTTSQNVLMPGDWPWMVALCPNKYLKKQKCFKCDGTLISNQWFVTSASCVGTMGQNPTLLIARLGDLDLYDHGEDKAKPIDMAVRKIVVHPHFFTNQPNSIPINSGLSNDIALVQLAEPVNFTKLIRPICILSESRHKSDDFYSNKIPFLVGWSAAVPVPNYKPNNRYSFTLKESQTDVIDNKECAELYKNVGSLSPFDERVLCAKNEKDVTCQGGSGGAFIMPIETTYYLAGIASYGVRCDDSAPPAVFTRIASFADWIKNTTGI